MGKLQEAEKAKEKKSPKHPASTQSDADESQEESQEAGNAPDNESDADDGAAEGGADTAVPSSGQPGEPQDESAQDNGPDAAQGGADQTGDDSDQSAQGGPPQAQGSAAAPTGQAIPVPAGIKDAYDKANTALLSALYGNGHKVAAAVLQGIQPQGPHKIESVVHAVVNLFTQLNLKLKFSKSTPQIVLPFTKDIVNNVPDLAERGGNIQFSDQEAVAVLGSSLEMVMRIIGVTKQQMATFQSHVGQSKMQSGLANYKAALQHTKGARGPTADEQPQNPVTNLPRRVSTPPNGLHLLERERPGPQRRRNRAYWGVGGTPGGTPQPGAPNVAAPGPGQSAPPGGMLSAAQPPQGQ